MTKIHNPYFDLIRAVWQNAKPWRYTIIAYYCAYIVAQGLLSFSPYAFGRTVDILQHFTPEKLPEMVWWLSASIIVLVLFWLFHGPARVKEREVALKIQQALRARLYRELTELPLRWHQDHHSGNTISRINRASSALYRFAGDQFVYIETIIKFVASSLFLLWISPTVGLLSLATCTISIVTVLLFDRKLIPLYNQQNEIDNHVSAVFFDYISNMTTILTLRLGALTSSNLWQRMLAVWPFFKKDIVLNEVKWFTMGMVLSVLQTIVLIGYIVHTLNINGAILIGTVVMIFRYQWDLSEVFYSFSAQYGDLVHMDTDVKGLQPILTDIKRFAHIHVNNNMIEKWHSITIKHLSFHHNSTHTHELLFNDLSFTINRGEKIALIGTSGGGKSTLLNLIRGLYTPTQASVEIDGISFDSLSPLDAITSLIPQDPEIFENTIAFNITLDVPTTADEIALAVKLAGFEKVLASLPHGLETDIREKGLNLSVGQKQRLALARGLFAARYSSLILMDEPTSSVDLPTEKQILANVIETFPDAAIIVSIHRLHLLPKFDRIIMLDHGRIVAAGPAKDLLNQPGPVRDLWLQYSDLN